jgi:AcrR family transcriptional regulator
MNMGRPREFDEERALEAAMTQFWLVGYEATSLQDLLNVMGLSKSSLYQAFGSKHALFLRCIDYYQKLTATNLKAQLERSRSGKEFIKTLLMGVIAEATLVRDKKGCLLANTANELSQRDKSIADAVAKGTGDLGKVLAHAIEIGKSDGSITSPSSTEVLAAYLLTNICGLRTMVKGGADEKSLKSVVNLILKSFDN